MKIKLIACLLLASVTFGLNAVVVINNTSELMILSCFQAQNVYWGLLESKIDAIEVPVSYHVDVSEYCYWAQQMKIKIGDGPCQLYQDLRHAKTLEFWETEEGEIKSLRT